MFRVELIVSSFLDLIFNEARLNAAVSAFLLYKICALALLHRGSLKYFENSNGRLNGLRAANSDSSVGMMRLKEQKAIFTGLRMTF